MDDVIHILPDDIEIVDVSEYSEDLTEYFSDMPEVARLLLKGAKEAFSKIEQMLYSSPAFINLERIWKQKVAQKEDIFYNRKSNGGRKMSARRYEISDEQWEQIKDMFHKAKTGRPLSVWRNRKRMALPF